MKKICVVVFFIVFDLYCGVNASNWRCNIDRKADINHGSYRKVGKYRVYKCDRGYVSNIPDLSKIRFKCGGDILWKTRKVKFSENNEILYAQNITCEKKVQCGAPPRRQDLTSQIVDQYQNKMSSSLDIREPGYYQGDRIKFSCYDGYEDKAFATVSYDYYGLYDSTTVSEITCNSTGLWNDLPSDEVPLMECAAIQCDATQYMNISNGNITNYKDIYDYFERMELSCDEGFRPKDGIESLLCISSSSFFLSDNNFGCEPITCIPPVDPVNGWVKVNGSHFGDKAYFQCDYGIKLIGQSEWTCQSDGSWDSTCVICDDENSYCPPPCIPLGAEIISIDTTFQLSSTVEFTCSGDQNLNSTIRTCMRNKDWSGQPIDCTGESRFDPYVGSSILTALETTISKINRTNTLALMDVQGRSIDVGNTFGVDVYFVIDVSKSINKQKMELRNNFISALFPQLGINNELSGTRLAFYYFASKTKKLINQHYLNAEDVFSNYTEAQQYIKLHTNLDEIQKQTKFGTSITTALEDIAKDIRSKQMSATLRQAQQVVIVISDGQYNTNGDPTEMADKLKQKPYEAEIYSILVGVDEKKHYNAYLAMSNIASNIENEQHFFAVRNDRDFTEIVNNMVSKGSTVKLKCGTTSPYKTKLSDGNKPQYEQNAEKYAWPWMAQLVGNKGKHECGGSLINKQWILTAAHCVPNGNEIQAVILQILRRGEKEGIVRREIQPNFITKHPQFNKDTYAYDVALIRFDLEVIISHKLLPVCLPPLTGEDLVKEGVFGVVTGWGKSKLSDAGPVEYLKQMQMRIKKCENGRSDENIMFCAGDKADGKIIDTCDGDSGGPFVVRIKNDTTRFTQIGIVSHGSGCKQNEQNGVYTKLTKDILTWIYDVAFKNDTST